MTTPRTTDQTGNPAITIIAWVVAVLTLFYMLPWAIAATRHKSNHGAIAVLNLLLGWTFIGWIVALVMACGAHQQAATPVIMGAPTAPPPGWYPAPDGSAGQVWWDGQRWTEQRQPA